MTRSRAGGPRLHSPRPRDIADHSLHPGVSSDCAEPNLPAKPGAHPESVTKAHSSPPVTRLGPQRGTHTTQRRAVALEGTTPANATGKADGQRLSEAGLRTCHGGQGAREAAPPDGSGSHVGTAGAARRLPPAAEAGGTPTPGPPLSPHKPHRLDLTALPCCAPSTPDPSSLSGCLLKQPLLSPRPPLWGGAQPLPLLPFWGRSLCLGAGLTPASTLTPTPRPTKAGGLHRPIWSDPHSH